MALAGCDPIADVPVIYHGRSGTVTLAVPSRIASSVLYDGESDRAPPEIPRSPRTDRDAIISHVDAWQRRLNWDAPRHFPAPIGPVLGVTVDPGPEYMGPVGRIRAAGERIWPGYRTLRPGPPLYGLEARHADWSIVLPDRKRHGGGPNDVDADFLSLSNGTYIDCKDERQKVPPFAPMPSCHMQVIDPAMQASLSAVIDRAILPRWRIVRAAMLRTLRSFRAAPDRARAAAPPRPA